MFFSLFQFFYKDVLEFQTCISGMRDLFLILTIWKSEVFRLEGAEGGHLGLSAGMGAGARMGLLQEPKGRPFVIRKTPSPLPPRVLLASSLQPAMSPSLTHVNDGSEGFFSALRFLFPVPRFLVLSYPHILALESLVPVAAAAALAVHIHPVAPL